jgi:hypothetical protein
LSIFELLMLICFGVAWPFSIYKSWKTRAVGSKSVIFLFVVLVGYAAGVLHKIFYNYNWVIFLYVLNGTMVSIDILLYLRNRLYHIRRSLEDARRGEEARRDEDARRAEEARPREPREQTP